MNDITIDINKDETEAQRLGRMIKYLRISTGMKWEDFANYFHIPLGTVRDWEQGKRKMPEYVYELIAYKASKELLREKENMDEKNKWDCIIWNGR